MDQQLQCLAGQAWSRSNPPIRVGLVNQMKITTTERSNLIRLSEQQLQNIGHFNKTHPHTFVPLINVDGSLTHLCAFCWREHDNVEGIINALEGPLTQQSLRALITNFTTASNTLFQSYRPLIIGILEELQCKLPR